MISEEIYKELESIVGEKWISNEPEMLQGYTNIDRGWDSAEARMLGQNPAVVILPANTEEVSEVIKVASRNNIGYTPVSTYFTPSAGATSDDCLQVDLKRLTTLDVDSRNQNATVGSGIVYAQLQAEALKHGLYTAVPGGGSQVGVIPNHLCWGFSPLTYRVGMANRRILGLEWVLPDGEIVRLGSLATGSNPFMGEGIGPDLRGLIRGSIGWNGSLGIVTKMTTKLLPIHNQKFNPLRIMKYTFLHFPEHRQRWYNFTCPSKSSMVEFMLDVSHAEIGAAMTRVPIAWRYLAKSTSKEDYWDKWAQDPEQKRKEVTESYILRFLLIGYTSEKQLEYEEKVLMKIAAKHKAEHRRTRQVDGSWMQSGDSVTMWWLTGAFMTVTGLIDALDNCIKLGEEFAKLKAQYTPPLMEDYGDEGWYQMNDMGHSGYLEFLNDWDPRDTKKNLEKKDIYFQVAGPQLLVDQGVHHFFAQIVSPLSIDNPEFGPFYGDFSRKIKEAFDPNYLSNPPGFLDSLDNVIDNYPALKKAKAKMCK